MQSSKKVTEFFNYMMAQEPRTLFSILNKLPRMGVGRKATRITWNVQDKNYRVRPAYWTITKVIPNEDLMSGKVEGTFAHRGDPIPRQRSVRSFEKEEWMLLPKNYDRNSLYDTDTRTDNETLI